MRIIEQIYRIIAPSDCLQCGREGSLLCSWCIDDGIVPQDSRCYKCNKLTNYFAVCPACRRKSPLKQVLIRSEYTKSSKELVHLMKFKYSTEAADIIADELLNTLPVLPEGTLIVGVPTITNHVRQRGFDHIQRICRRISLKSGYDYVPALVRQNQAAQVGSGRKARVSQQQHAFRVRKPGTVKNKHILLIDDVITTGATLESAGANLKEAGAKSVTALAFARSVI